MEAGTAQKIAYFDNNATTRPLPAVLNAMTEVLSERFGNASSAHSGGEAARVALSEARTQVADFLGANDEQIVFTSSGTEANNMAIHSGIAGGQGLVTSEIEHSSVTQMASYIEGQGTRVVRVEPTRSGLIRAEDVADAITTTKPSLVSIQWVNSETGVVQPVEEIAEVCRNANVLFHTDAAQAVGKLAVQAADIGADYVTCTAHKFHGPAGVGILYAKNPRSLVSMLHGGDQEFGYRAGTENLAGIVGAGVAASFRHERLAGVLRELKGMRDLFERRITTSFPWVSVNGGAERRVGNTSNLLFEGIDGQALVAQLDAIRIQCSQSSACTSMRPEPSRVLKAMGLSEKQAYSSVRFSVGEYNSMEEVGDATERMAPIIQRFEKLFR